MHNIQKQLNLFYLVESYLRNKTGFHAEFKQHNVYVVGYGKTKLITNFYNIDFVLQQMSIQYQ